MVSVAARWNTRPSGWNRTRFTLSDGAVAVMVTGVVRAPAGLDSACGPIVVTPRQADLIGALLQATGLHGCTRMPRPTATQAVGPAGVVIRIGAHALSVPAGGPTVC